MFRFLFLLCLSERHDETHEPSKRPSETVRVTRVRFKHQAVHSVEYYYRLCSLAMAIFFSANHEERKRKITAANESRKDFVPNRVIRYLSLILSVLFFFLP